MHHLTMFSRQRAAAIALGAAVLLGTGCAAKEAEFFSLLSGSSGTIEAEVLGAPDGATIQVTGNGINESRLVGSTVSAFPALPFGTYTVVIAPPDGYTCNPTSMQVTISETDPIRRASFTCSPMPGSFAVGLAGLSGGAQLDFSLTGPSPKSGSIGAAGLTFTGLLPGSYGWTYPEIDGYDCNPASGTFVLEPGETETASVSCVQTDGGITVSVSGATAMVSFSGPESGGGSVGSTPVNFAGLTPGTYTVSISNPTGVTCLPTSAQVTVTAGANTPVSFACTPLPATITATVSGATAQVNYSGAATGGGSVGSSPVAFTGLPTGNYTVTVVAPDGFTCTPESVAVTLTAGENEAVGFACEEEEPEEVVEYDIDLAGLQSPGVVAAGIYQRAVLNAALVTVATMNLRAFGGSTFYGTGPNRIGFGGSSGWEMDVLFPVAALVFRVQFLRLCALNAVLSAGNFIEIGYYNTALLLLATSQIIASPGCFNFPTPAGTRYIRLSGPAVGFADINGLRLFGVLVPPP